MVKSNRPKSLHTHSYSHDGHFTCFTCLQSFSGVVCVVSEFETILTLNKTMGDIMNRTSKHITQAGMTAALYVILTLLCSAFGLSSGVIQIRFSEALCILPCFMKASVPGLFLGCLISNILTGCTIYDIIFGSLATLIGAIGTYCLRKNRYLACLPPILSNVIIIPFVLIYTYNVSSGYWFILITIAAGEIISCGLLGQIIYSIFQKSQLQKLIN